MGAAHHSNIQEARKVECRRFVKLYFWKGLSEGITRNSSTLLSLVVVLLPLAQDKPLGASVVFSALAFADSIAYNSVRTFNHGISVAADYFSASREYKKFCFPIKDILSISILRTETSFKTSN